MSNPWDVPELSEPDADVDKLFSSVGRALSAWEALEHHLATFFGFFATNGADSTASARRAYGSVASFQARSSMLAAAAEIYFASRPGHEFKERFDALLEEAVRFSARRNEIAHGRASPAYIGDTDKVLADPSLLRWVLMPMDYLTSKNRLLLDTQKRPFGLSPKYIYSSTEIIGLATHFRRLEKEAFNLMIDWSRLQPDESPAPRI